MVPLKNVLKVKLFAVTVVLAAGAAGAFETTPQIFKPGSAVLFQGDSVTHGGRMGDVNRFMGRGCQAEIAMRHLAYRPDGNLQFGACGESGRTSSNLVARRHCDAFHPACAGHVKMADLRIGTKRRTSLRAVMPAIPDAGWTKGWWMSRHKQKLAEIRKLGSPKVVFLGDSITHFWEVAGLGLRTWNKYFTNETYKAVNLGFSGDRTEHVLWRIAHGELDGYRAKAVVLMLGTNNTGHFPIEREPPEATILGMQAVVRAIRAKQPQAKLVLCAIFPCDKKADGSRRLRNEIVNKEIQKLADGRNVFWLDFTAAFLTADGELLGEIMPDSLHPAAHGYEIWANAVIPYLNHALTVKDGDPYLFPSTFAPRVKPEVTGAHTMPAQPVAMFGQRWWGEFADRPLETMKKIADNPVTRVDEKGVTNRWFDVVMVGDSIMHRWERRGCGGEETWAMLTNRYAVLNLGYDGDSTEHCLWRMKYGELYGYKAKLFVVMIGTNNNGAQGTARGIEAVVRAIREIRPESKVVLLDIFPRNATADDSMRRKCANISAEARQFLGDRDPNVVFLDLNAKFLAPDGTLTKEIFPDLLHPAAKGYRIWYDAILPIIEEIVGR